MNAFISSWFRFSIQDGVSSRSSFVSCSSLVVSKSASKGEEVISFFLFVSFGLLKMFGHIFVNVTSFWYTLSNDRLGRSLPKHVLPPPPHAQNLLSVLSAPGFGGISGAQALTNKELKKLIPEKINTPLNELLQNQEDGNVEVTGAGRRWNQSRTVRTNLGIPTRENQVQSLGLPLEVCGEASAEPNFIPNIPDQADLFLAPMNNKGIFKALLIPDFVSKIVREVDESVINLGPRAKLSVSYGLQKPKLSDITVIDKT